MPELLSLLGLFASAFGAASLLPLQSEPVLVGLLLLGDTPAWLLVLVASIGNTLGAVLNWWLGGQVDRFRDRRWFPVPPAALDRAAGWYHRWGRWSLLLSWAPIIGDPLTLVAGVLKEPIGTFLLLVAIAKTARYVALAWATLSLA
ncbi:MAG: DedA family protein [Roseomonas sp.]|nr:DedA family protein [Roseomonas sp.]